MRFMRTPVVLGEVRVVDVLRPLVWLARGWRDLQRAPGLGLLHGLVFLGAAFAIATLGWRHGGLLAGAFSAFLLLAPALCTGLYEMSRRTARGDRPSAGDVLSVWVRGGPAMVRLGLLLAAAGAFWVLLSALLVSAGLRISLQDAVASGGIGSVSAFINGFVLSPDPSPFLVWLLTGGLMASMVFATCAVSMPMLVDRDVPLRAALLTSVRAVGANPVPMAFWAALVMSLTVLALGTIVLMPFLVPLLGHATWHAYADTVDASALAPRV